VNTTVPAPALTGISAMAMHRLEPVTLVHQSHGNEAVRVAGRAASSTSIDGVPAAVVGQC
jgi:hypothetical protein